MRGVLLLTVLAALSLSGCAGVIDRCAKGLNDPGSDQMTREHHQ